MSKNSTNKKLTEETAIAADSAPVAPDIEAGEYISQPEKTEAGKVLTIEASARMFTSIVNGDNPLFQGVGVEKIVVYLRGE
ncbi:MAG: hypothetical protein IJ240_01620 [Clostridia bacterium]|nr:hypothetical protein [Clostridia bacterium]